MGDAPYRDDREADQARIAALEADLKATKSKLEDLEGRRSQALVLAGASSLTNAGTSSRGTRIAGAPMKLELVRTFDFAFPADKFEDLVEAIRAITRDRGRTELMRSSVAWWASTPDKSIGPFTAITVTVKDGATTLVVSDRLGQLAGAIYGGVGGGIGGGAIMLPVFAAMAMPVLIPVVVVGWLGGVFAGSRALFKNRAKKRAVTLQRVFDAMVVEIERSASSNAAPSV